MLVILRDTREGLPLPFDGIDGVDKVEDIGLLYGDYGAIIDGVPAPVYFERKSLGDLWTTMASGEYERFKREIAKAKSFGHKLILITEGTYLNVQAGYEYSEYSGESMIKKLHTMAVKHDLEWWACENREVMAERIVHTFTAIQRMWSKKK